MPEDYELDKAYPEMGGINRIESEPLHSGGGYTMRRPPEHWWDEAMGPPLDKPKSKPKMYTKAPKDK